MEVKLTLIQEKIFEYIKTRIQSGFPPTLAEIASHFNYKNRATVQQHLKALEKKGYLKRNPNVARGLEIVNDDFFIKHPVYGEVAAGSPLTIYENEIDTVELPKAVKLPSDSFLLKVKGDSLKDAFIFEGDVIIVNPNLEPKSGRIAVMILDDSAVVKRLKITGSRLELHSENPEYQPIILYPDRDNFKFVGIVVGIYRTMEY